MTAPAADVYQPKPTSPPFFHFTDEMLEAAWQLHGGPMVTFGTWLSKPLLQLPWGPLNTADY
jgi:hypothetical protein